MNKRERLGLIAVLVALVGLAVDRLLLPPPPTAAADDDGGDGPAGAVLKAGLVAAAVPAPVPERALTAVNVPDVFDWSRLERATSAGLAASAGPRSRPDDAALRAQAFATSHVLSATVLGPRPIALVGERALQIGDRLDGFVLAAIGLREAVFVSDKQRVVLRVPAAQRKD